MRYEVRSITTAFISTFQRALSLICAALFATVTITAQTPSPSPKPADTPYTVNGFEVTSSIEVGVRGLDVNGSDNKFRSDFNYKPGLRIFDSSFLIENKEKKTGGFFDSLLVTSSGWNADPTGAFRLSVEKAGLYQLDSSVRQVTYFNNLANHSLNQHNADTKHHFGDIDLTVFPESEDLRFRFGYSFNRTDGSGSFTTRAYSDEFPVLSDVNLGSYDLRAGVEGKWLGWNLSFLEGYRSFSNNSSYSIQAPHLGNNPTNNPRLATFQRNYPIEGDSLYATLRAQRTFANRFDVTGRLIYSFTDTTFKLFETITGRDNSNNFVDLDRFDASGRSERPQTRGDIGVTYRATSDFRISDTFTFDQYNVSGGNRFFEVLNRRNAGGNPLAATLTSTTAHRINAYRRIQNLIEADYQVNRFFGFNVGYRFARRRVVLEGSDRNLLNPAAPPSLLLDEEFDNTTHTLIAGTKVQPVKNWTIFADIEHGDADNAFTRLSNYKFTNFRVRSRANIKKVALNLSYITKDNENPSASGLVPGTGFLADIKSRTFSGSLDWEPVEGLMFSTGYTYQSVTSVIDIEVPISSVIRRGVSEFYMRDNYFFFDVSANPINRVSLFASYRYNKDKGQGNRVATLPENFVTSYPFKLQSPEVRLAFRLTDNIDWNVGYQYYDYKENLFFNQNYSAHLPYTSIKIYFGGGDRR